MSITKIYLRLLLRHWRKTIISPMYHQFVRMVKLSVTQSHLLTVTLLLSITEKMVRMVMYPISV